MEQMEMGFTKKAVVAEDRIPANAEFVVNFSGGKDSCAMLAYICEQYPTAKKHVILADTGWEHEGLAEWCRSIVVRYGLTLSICKNPNKDFFAMVEHRGKFPAPAQRQCTSDLKRGPIQTWTRRNVTASTIVNCLGLRAEESSQRAKKVAFSVSKDMTNGKRTVYDWLPIHSWTEKEVLAYLAERNIPLHPAYSYLPRLSCQVCIFFGKKELQAVKANNPAAFDRIAALEKKIRFTMKPEGSVESIVNS